MNFYTLDTWRDTTIRPIRFRLQLTEFGVGLDLFSKFGKTFFYECEAGFHQKKNGQQNKRLSINLLHGENDH